MADSRIESLLSGKPHKVQNKLRKAFMDAGIDDSDPIWALIEIFNAYSEEINESSLASELAMADLKDIRENISGDIKKSITSHSKMIRDASFAEYASQLDDHAEYIRNSLLDQAEAAKKALSEKQTAVNDGLAKLIDIRQQSFENQIDHQMNKLVESAVRSRVHPVARMISSIVSVTFLIFAMAAFASVFMFLGAHASVGNLEFLPELLNVNIPGGLK